MSSPLEPIVGRLVGDNTDYIRSLNDAERRTGSLADDTDRHFGRMGASIGKFAKVAAVGLGGAAVGVGLFLKKSVEAAEESRKVTAQTEAVIKSTGGAANVSAAQVGAYADSLAALTGIDDEVIAGGQNVLLTFTQVRNEAGKGNDIFNQGTKAALNMSVALKQDLASSSMLVGKALNDPIKGMASLTRSGIQFTEQQKAQVKAMVESGNVLGAQKIILKELETQFGGSAEAAASPMARLKVVVGNLQEELGARFLPVISKVAGFLADKLPGALDAVGRAIGPVFSYIREVVGFIGPAIASAFSGEGVTSDGIVGVAERVGVALRAIVDWVKKNWPEIKRIITETMKTVQSVIKGVVDVITTIWENFGDQITDVVKAAWTFVKATIEAALKVIQGIVKTVTSLIHGDWSGVWEGIKMILAGAWDFIMARVEFAINIVKNILSVAWEIIKGAASGAWDGIKDMFASAWDGIIGLARNGVARIVDTFLGMAGSLIGIAEKAFGWMPVIGDDIRRAARAFEEFRDRTNAALRGTDSEKTINVYHNVYHREYYEAIRGQDPWVGNMHTGGIVPGSGDVPMILKGGEGVFTPEQMAAIGAGLKGGSAVTTSGGSHGGTMHVSLQIIAPTGDIPDETIRKIRSALFELGNDVPSSSIVPA